MTRRYQVSATCFVLLGLCAGVLAVYWPVGGHGFVNLDDQLYVYENPVVRSGLAARGVVWAFTTFHTGNWHPLTWLSHMADVEMFGLDAGWHHRVSVLLHSLNSVLLFLVLRTATGKTWRCAFVSGLFALHPMHVESVAWVAERKDVLSTFFWLLAMWAYVLYARKPSLGAYLELVGFFCLGLLSKPMLVTFPLTLLLLDFWPLERVARGACSFHKMALLIREKIPLLLLSGAASLVTYLAQFRGGGVSSVGGLSIKERVANALVSYVWYIAKMSWPVSLAEVYPHPGMGRGGVPAWQATLAALVLGGVCALVFWQRRRRPFLVTGWFWYLITLVPVIGLVQVGVQATADRYTYVPLIGLFILIAWAVPDALVSSPRQRGVWLCLASTVLLAAASLARTQVGYWRDSISLHEHALRVTGDNWHVLINLGAAYREEGRYQEAVQAYLGATRSVPFFPQPWRGLGLSYYAIKEFAAAASCFERALYVDPGHAATWHNLGAAYALSGQVERAREVQDRLLRMDPGLARQLLERIGEIEPGR